MLTITITHASISCNMSAERSKNPEESLVAYYTRVYSYDAAWKISPKSEYKDGVVTTVQKGELSPIGRQTTKGWVYIVDEFSRVNARRHIGNYDHGAGNVLLEKVRDGKCQTPVPKFPNTQNGDLEACGQQSKHLILDNGRWQEESNITGHCSEEHASIYMNGLVDAYYDENGRNGDWDFLNAPVFGVFTPHEGWKGETDYSPFDTTYWRRTEQPDQK